MPKKLLYLAEREKLRENENRVEVERMEEKRIRIPEARV
jgi:hypothetical protein